MNEELKLTDEQKKALASGLTKSLPEDRRRALELFYTERDKAFKEYPEFKAMFEGLIAMKTTTD